MSIFLVFIIYFFQYLAPKLTKLSRYAKKSGENIVETFL